MKFKFMVSVYKPDSAELSREEEESAIYDYLREQVLRSLTLETLGDKDAVVEVTIVDDVE